MFRRQKLWAFLDACGDTVMIMISITDIICDILVTSEFWRLERWNFFYGSISIFILAQLGYAFIFTAVWGRLLQHNLKKSILFICVFPFAQLLPFFAWLEALHFPTVDKCLRRLSLAPTSTIMTPSSTDTLWQHIQRKYQSHAGFVAEAFLEAIPQCMLQVSAVIIYHGVTPLGAISILSSIVTIASKGYLLSYSIHKPTFYFNFLCIAADCFGVFATITWLCIDLQYAGLYELPFKLQATHLGTAYIGVIAFVLAGFAAVVWSVFDDHLKIITRRQDYEMKISSLWFEIYFTRFFAYFLATIPFLVVYFTSKLSLLPILLLRSLDPHHAVHANFYRPLFEFLFEKRDPTLSSESHGSAATLDKQDADLRLQTANKLLAQARLELSTIFKHSLEAWLAMVGNHPTTTSQSTNETAPDLDLERKIVRTAGDLHADVGASRSQIRKLKLTRDVERSISRTSVSLLERSEVLQLLRTYKFQLSDLTHAPGILRLLAMISFLVAAVLAFVCLPTTALYVVTSAFYPIVYLLHHYRFSANLAAFSLPSGMSTSSTSCLGEAIDSLVLGAGTCTGDAAVSAVGSTFNELFYLPLLLTKCYLACIAGLVLLLPFVARFQIARADLLPLDGFPDKFFSPKSVAEIRRRYGLELLRRDKHTFLRQILSRDPATIIQDFTGDDIH